MPAVTALKGKLEARPYNGPSAFVAASFQLAILSFRVSVSLGATESASHGVAKGEAGTSESKGPPRVSR